MANKAFEVQDSKIRIGGVDLEAGTTGVVIPGVTQATSYKVEEINDTGDQTYQFAPDTEGVVVVIDVALYNTIIAQGNESGFADYTVVTDGEGYIDEIKVNGQGSYTQLQARDAETADMYAYIGAGSASDRPLVTQDWIQVPFRPKMRAGQVETIGGGSSLAVGNGNGPSIQNVTEILIDGSVTEIDPGVVGISINGGGNANVGTFSTLPDFLDFAPNTTLHAGQTASGVFFSGNAGSATVSYPVRTAFTIAGDQPVVVTVDMEVNDECSDFGLCVFEDGTEPQWQWNNNPTRIAAQYSCVEPEIDGIDSNTYSNWVIPGPGTYRVKFTYDPSNTPNVKLETLDTSDNVLDTITLDEQTLNTSNSYRIGFGADQDSANLRTYIKNLTINVNSGQTVYTDSLTFSGASGNQLVSVSTGNTFALMDEGDVVFDGTGPGGVNRGLVWQYGNNQSGINSMVRQDQSGLTVRAWTENSIEGNFSASVNIVTNQDSAQNTWQFDGAGILTLPAGGDIVDSNGTSVLGGGGGSSAQLVGNGYVAGTGSKVTVYSDYQGYTGGEGTGIILPKSQVGAFTVGDTITFRNGEVRTISNVDTGFGDNNWIQWADEVVGDTFNNPRFPMTFTTATYIPDTKKTARIKPDLDTEGSGQYMDVYVGGTMVLDHKHVHMAGHEADTELFLGTDNNFISTKEAGRSPAQVNLKSENDITVSDSNLRMTRGNTWISVYGDGENRDWRDYSQDLSWDLVETDDQGNYYVGGENHWGPEAMVGKYGPDGDLIWKKVVNRDNTNSWNISGAAYNPVDKEVAFAFETNINRNHDYAKVTVFDSDTGDVKRTFDVFDPDGNIYVRAMDWHQTLGYMAVGNTSGELGTTGNISSVNTSRTYTTATDTTLELTNNEVTITDNGSLPSVAPQVGDTFLYNNGVFTVTSVNTYSTYYGLVSAGSNFGYPVGAEVTVLHGNNVVGIIELPRASVKIGGNWPQGWSNWYISGTGITGTQTIQNGIGLYQNVPLTNVTGIGSGMTVTIRVDYQNNYYEFYTQGSTGVDYQNGDQVKIPGSLLGGVDNGLIQGANPISYDTELNTLTFNSVTYDTMANLLSDGRTWSVTCSTPIDPASVVGVVDNGNETITVTLSGSNLLTGISPADSFTFTAPGNDLLATVADNSNIYALTGTPSLTANFRIDMGYQMGYGTTDFINGTFEITTTLGDQAFVWCDSWSKVFEAENTSTSYAYAIAVDKVWGDVIVGGNENGTNRNFVWKLDAAGATQWVKRITDDYNNNVTSVAVSSVNRSIYFTTNSTSINKLDMDGNFMKRVQPDGMWGFNNAIAKLEQSIDGEEYLYIGGGYGAIWTNGGGFLVSKLNSNLELMWTRSIRNNNRSLDTHYDSFHNNFVLGRDRAVLAGYTYFGSPNWDNAFLASISTGDNFDTVQIGNWYLDVIGNDVRYTDQTANYAVEDCLVNGATTTNSTLDFETNTSELYLTNWSWKSALVKLDTTLNGIVGVESIAFAEGGVLDHNPSDIPPVITDFSQTGWNYTLQLSDRGKFITNGKGIENYTGNLYITVPSNLNLTFPVGSVITLINISDVNSNNNRIYVQPENYSSNDCPRIYATGFGTTWSTWSFPGIQTATLMKIGSNEWLLTANNIQDEN